MGATEFLIFSFIFLAAFVGWFIWMFRQLLVLRRSKPEQGSFGFADQFRLLIRSTIKPAFYFILFFIFMGVWWVVRLPMLPGATST